MRCNYRHHVTLLMTPQVSDFVVVLSSVGLCVCIAVRLTFRTLYGCSAVSLTCWNLCFNCRQFDLSDFVVVLPPV